MRVFAKLFAWVLLLLMIGGSIWAGGWQIQEYIRISAKADQVEVLMVRNRVLEGKIITMEKQISELQKQHEVLQKQMVSRGTNHKPVFYRENLLKKSGITVQQAVDFLPEPLKPYAYDFILAEKESGINAVFLMSKARLESGNGTYKYMDRNNIFAYGANTSNPDNAYSYNSVSECIRIVSNKMKENYLTEGGKFFKGYSMVKFNSTYTEDDACNTHLLRIMRNEGVTVK